MAVVFHGAVDVDYPAPGTVVVDVGAYGRGAVRCVFGLTGPSENERDGTNTTVVRANL
jgi:hypothetical protein